MKLSQLKKKFPNAFHKFYTSRFCENYYLRIANTPILETDVRNHWKEITDFMDKQEIIIQSHNSNDWKFYGLVEYMEIDEYNHYATDYFETRKQAETKAIEKAFEILEGRVK